MHCSSVRAQGPIRVSVRDAVSPILVFCRIKFLAKPDVKDSKQSPYEDPFDGDHNPPAKSFNVLARLVVKSYERILVLAVPAMVCMVSFWS
jgi:hypothetical protein